MITRIIREDAHRVAADLAETLAPLAGSNVLITGAGGFLGSFFLDVLAAFNEANPDNPCRIVAADNFLVGLPERIAHLKGTPHIEFRTVDVSKPAEYDPAPDYIIHCAGIASPWRYRAQPLETIDVNVGGTRNMLELARNCGARSMLSFSSSEIYGDPDPAWIPTPEHYRGYVSCTGPRACYDESKRLNETLCVTYARHYGVPVKIIRPFNTYGPGQRIDDGRIVPDMMKAAIEGGPLVLYSDGRATRSFCYVSDFVSGCLHVMMSDANGEPFNVGNDQEISIGAAAELMARIAAEPPLTVEYRVNPDSDYLVDNPQRRCPDLTKLRTMTPWTPKVSLEEGLTRTLASYREEMAMREGMAPQAATA
ncbi:NAD-dependent epimerase/dehydratase family protein [Telmatospirillum sp. J64-1]|uniref:NAD-dependent epimerase/dehydratase family protein n=1 Tax=Telmatospirillum sp. J64-1 TaxID=2502183 RepID=UPI00115CE7D4|nr:NAD-dependent epimerase/dehydratase family protein [Telmatospirillum sp. J64-1]